MTSRIAAVAFLSTILFASKVSAIGDFPCFGTGITQSCLAWSTAAGAGGPISPTADCLPDPINPAISYCGYANSTCTQNLDCDYGSCQGGTCRGYLGDACASSLDCQAYFFCGTDGVCGGGAAACGNVPNLPFPDQQCLTTCTLATQTCAAVPTTGVPNGSVCGNNAICASNVCTNNICSVFLGPSGVPTKKVKRFVLNGSGPNNDQCPAGQTACAVGFREQDGFECIDVDTNIEQCGGCASASGAGVGQDCTAIPNADLVLCEEGSCLVLSCTPGFEPNAKGNLCVMA